MNRIRRFKKSQFESKSRVCCGTRAGFTLTELMVVIGVIILLAAMTVGGVSRAVSKGKETRVRAELAQLITAIEAYKSDINSYPPDNPVYPARSPLFYELSGVVVTNRDGIFSFSTHGADEVLSTADAKAWLGVDGFQNAVMNPDQIRTYLTLRSEQYGEITDDVEVLLVPVPWPRAASQQPIPDRPGLNPWRYRAPENRSATNNPGSFELWAEYVDGNNVRVVSNWRDDAYVDRDFVK
jgi:type II secretory pathway pseudopilin PulG